MYIVFFLNEIFSFCFMFSLERNKKNVEDNLQLNLSNSLGGWVFVLIVLCFFLDIFFMIAFI